MIIFYSNKHANLSISLIQYSNALKNKDNMELGCNIKNEKH